MCLITRVFVFDIKKVRFLRFVSLFQTATKVLQKTTESAVVFPFICDEEMRHQFCIIAPQRASIWHGKSSLI